MARFIGIRHRIKKTAEGEAHPTQIAIIDNTEKIITYDLPDETAELDWALHRFPVKFRSVTETDDLSNFLAHQIVWKKMQEEPSTFPRHLIKKEGKIWFVASKVPVEFDGLKNGDIVSMVLGGSGDYLAYALSRKAQDVNAQVVRITQFHLKENRIGEMREDASLLAKLAQGKPELFFETEPRDRELILLRKSWMAREDAMKARIACEQRLRQRLIGNIFCQESGLYPEGGIEKLFAEAKANDKISQALLEEEKQREKELVKVVSELEIYEKLFEPIVGCGPMIASRIIVAVGDIRRFATAAKLKAYCGVHVLPDGRFPRRRNNELANWKEEARQGLYLLGDQFNRRPESEWGQKFRAYKMKLRGVHPEVEKVNGKSRYTDGHIHKMASWRTLTKFVEKWLFREWWKIEKSSK